jgi:hypothetical protein
MAQARFVPVEMLRRGLERIVPAAVEYDDVLLDAAAACTLLRCQDDALELLAADGLPTVPSSAGPRFRRCDVLNVGLYSGSGRTIPEVAESHRVRWTAEPSERWVAPRSWTVGVELRCRRCAAGEWRMPPPVPERFGGEVHAWPRTPIAGASPVRLDGSVAVRGVRGTVASPAARRIFGELVDDLIAERLRYQYLPPGLRSDPDAAARAGALDCMAASLLLASRCRSEDVAARTRKGLLLGGATVEHIWVEVRGDAGWEPLDPVLPALAARSAGSSPDFVEFVRGSVSNRLLSWDLDAHEELVSHICSDGGAPAPAAVVMNASAATIQG